MDKKIYFDLWKKSDPQMRARMLANCSLRSMTLFNTVIGVHNVEYYIMKNKKFDIALRMKYGKDIIPKIEKKIQLISFRMCSRKISVFYT